MLSKNKRVLAFCIKMVLICHKKSKGWIQVSSPLGINKYNRFNNVLILQKIKIFEIFESCLYNTNEVIAMLLKRERRLEKKYVLFKI